MKIQKLSLIALTSLLIILSACKSNDDTTVDGNDDTTVTTDCTTTATASQSTNTEIETMRQAMVDFRNSLSSTLLSIGSVCLDDERFYLWHNTPANNNNRDGITYGDLSDSQLKAFKGILQLFLSAEGYQKVYEITELSEGWLNDIMSNVWSPDYYLIDMFGDPETSGSWGFQLDGHHCVVNFLVHGDNVSIVPAFLGGEPAAETYNGEAFDIFSDERDLALTLYNSFSSTELTTVSSTSASHSLEVGPADMNGDVDPYRGTYDYSGFETGLKYSDMSATVQANLLLVMKEYVYNLSTNFADVWWADIMIHIDDTYLVWINDSETTPTATSEFYYRIYNPYLWVEFNTEGSTGANSGTIADYNHIHTITRIPNNPATDNGGDYGIFAQIINDNGVKTLYEHYALADHHNESIMKFDYTVKGIFSHHSHRHDHIM
ncbi:DUF3500 domain-containing protein [Reichenbachiella agarivorans]|uniref:DUF3500 domain-containing protein n=1 Tax=Reichenbachiella agarivorans TaxID=2979464 RepID=A0ABY6CJD7_9BACT|nr:DUF3500 domain-containing protein [Reichenbachiella agarivorans]UXP30631.1 DUF3500 domain-containing protein [Reichenbachiella agarivorans]